jgi:hypothetical protein
VNAAEVLVLSLQQMTSSGQTPPQENLNMPLIQEPQAEDQEENNLSKERTERIRIKNRRKMYLDRHPSYFTSPDLELAGASNLLKH